MTPPQGLLHAEPDSRDFPQAFRVRVHLWAIATLQRREWWTGMGEVVDSLDDSVRCLFDTLRSAYGRERLVGPRQGLPWASGFNEPDWQLKEHVKHCDDVEVLDFIDAVFHLCAELIGDEDVARDEWQRMAGEINVILEEEGVGYRVVEGRLVRSDGEVTHQEAVVPALAALATGRFGAAEQEFAEAVAAFGRGAYRDTVTYAGAGLESVLKVVTGKNLDAGKLIREVRGSGLIPQYLGTALDGVDKVMHAIPAARGQAAAHGLGLEGEGADERVARFVLTTTAATIELLASAPGLR